MPTDTDVVDAVNVVEPEPVEELKGEVTEGTLIEVPFTRMSVKAIVKSGREILL